MTELTVTADDFAQALRSAGVGQVFLPGEPGYDAARTPWNLAVEQLPAAVVVPTTATEVANAVRVSAAAGLRVVAQSTGHGAGPLAGRTQGTVLLRLSDFTGVSVDAEHGIVRVLGATLWQDVVDAAAAHGLAVLHGSSPDVAAAGYLLGGGLSWYARRHGLACNHLVAAEVVLADGSIVRTDADHHPDLFWAIRGGGGSFGVVVALELKALPMSDVFAGMMLWDGARAVEITQAWAEWTHGLPEEVTTALRLLSFPPLPDLPDFLRGRRVVVIDGAVLTDDQQASALLAPLRALAPELDTFARVPLPALTAMHMDPQTPVPGVSDHTLLDDFDRTTALALVAAAGPESGTTLLSAEIRHLGGALGRPAAGGGALRGLPGAYSGFFVAMAVTPELAALGRADGAKAVAALSPWSNRRRFANFAEEAVDVSSIYEPDVLARLRTVREQYDPTGLFVAGHAL